MLKILKREDDSLYCKTPGTFIKIELYIAWLRTNNDTCLLLMYNTCNTSATPLNNAHPGGFFSLEV